MGIAGLRVLCRAGLVLASMFSLPGCSDEAESASEGFVCKGACVDGIGLSMPNGRRHAGPLPTSTATGREPVITRTDWVAAGGDKLLLVVTAESGVPFDQIYFEISGQVFLIDSVESVADVAAFDLCKELVTRMGYGCSDACVEASQCARCKEPWREQAAQGSLAALCSTVSHDIPFGPGEAWESESQFVNEQWASSLENAAVADLYPGCSAEICESSAASSTNLRIFEFTYDYSSLIFEPMMVVPSAEVSTSPPMSSRFAVGELSNPKSCCPSGFGYCERICN